MEYINDQMFSELGIKIEEIRTLPTDTDKINSIINTLNAFNQILQGYASNINSIITFAGHQTEATTETTKVFSLLVERSKVHDKLAELIETNADTIDAVSETNSTILKIITSINSQINFINKRIDDIQKDM